jgi:hypothetical protein
MATIKQHNDIFVRVTDLTNIIHTNKTGAFLLTSQQGNRYIMVGIHLDFNYIFCELMKSKTEGKIITANQKMVDQMKLSALGLKHQWLDNEALQAFKACIKTNSMTHELVPPNNHRQNIAKWAIQTFMNHFVSILSRVDNKFPLLLWCHLLSPAELAVKLLCQSNVAPNNSVCNHIHKHHNYMKHPFAPLVCTVQAHVKQKKQPWDVICMPVTTLAHQWITIPAS